MDETKFYQYCLQGDVTSAYEYLCSLPNKSRKEQELESAYYNRFFHNKPEYPCKSDDSWIQNVLQAYYQYFSAVLTRKSVDHAEKRLIFSLRNLIPGIDTKMDLESLEKKLGSMFNEKGYHFLGGITPPFRGPYIWKNTEERKFTVELPNLIQEVKVYFLSDFILQSWVHFATFGEKFAAGWAKPDGLYYVADRPEHKKVELASSEFQVSYLKHEAQHLNDFLHFPNLRPRDLEYRAKLVELIYEPNSYRLLKKFYCEQKADPRHPHSYASFTLMKRLTQMAFGKEESQGLEQWKFVDFNKISEWSLALFNEHTEMLETKGKETIGII